MQSAVARSRREMRKRFPGCGRVVNQAQQRLIFAGGETGFFGGWQKVVFQVNRCNPYITLPRELARVINMDVCRFPIRIQNEFFEMLEAGVGLQDFCTVRDWCGALEGYERGVFPTMVDVATSNQFLRVYLTDTRDLGKRVLIGPASDQNGNNIYSQDGLNSVNGFYLPLAPPFTTSAFIVTSIGGVQKDATFGDVLLYQVDRRPGAGLVVTLRPGRDNPGLPAVFHPQAALRLRHGAGAGQPVCGRGDPAQCGGDGDGQAGVYSGEPEHGFFNHREHPGADRGVQGDTLLRHGRAASPGAGGQVTLAGHQIIERRVAALPW